MHGAEARGLCGIGTQGVNCQKIGDAVLGCGFVVHASSVWAGCVASEASTLTLTAFSLFYLKSASAAGM